MCEPSTGGGTEGGTEGTEQQTCPEGEVLNADTQMCEPSTEEGGTEQQTCPEGEVFNADTQICEPSTEGEQKENRRRNKGTDNKHVQKVKYSMQTHRYVSHLQKEEQKEEQEQQTCPEGEVFNADTQMCEPSTKEEQKEERTTNMSRR